MATEVGSIERVVDAFSENPIYDVLVHRLAEIASTWRSTKADDLIPCYNVVLLTLIELGFNEALDFDVCLPSRLMIAEYHSDGWHIHNTTLEIGKEPQKA
jgi:hypothetical protein